MKSLRHFLVLSALLGLAACQTTAVDKPAPVPSATPAPAPASTPAPAKDPVSGAPSTKTSTGSPAPTDKTDQPDKTAKTGESTTANPGDPETSEERRVAVAKQLDESLGTWDATLRKEQSDLAKSREQRAEDTSKAAEKNGESVEDVNADAGIDPNDKVAKNGDLKSDADNKTNSKDNGAGHQGDVGEGRVDDIVGRQICEAARSESDPELKEKLQKECQKYRDGTH